jgi:NAD(P)-dependent dehydrogenase (short-subunit alcohol dehydrogenase family)
MNVNLEGQVALVTGAGRGIGEIIGHRLAANGAQVVYADIDIDTARQSAAKSPRGRPLRMDVTSEQEVEAGVARVVNECGRLDILVNNAGVNSPPECRVNIDRFSLAEWERVMKVDLNGVFLVSRAAACEMIQRKSGRIINIASVLGVVPARLQCAYTAAKAAVVNLTRTMAIELGPDGILVNCIAPGTMQNTHFYSKDLKLNQFARRLLDHVPLGRPGTFEDIAHAALYLAAPESSYVTGQTLCVDGGWTAGGFFRDF